MTDPQDYLGVPWYVVVEDLIGGWAVATVNKPTSEIDNRPGSGNFVITDFISLEAAEHVASLHNQYIGAVEANRELVIQRMMRKEAERGRDPAGGAG